MNSLRPSFARSFFRGYFFLYRHYLFIIYIFIYLFIIFIYSNMWAFLLFMYIFIYIYCHYIYMYVYIYLRAEGWNSKASGRYRLCSIIPLIIFFRKKTQRNGPACNTKRAPPSRSPRASWLVIKLQYNSILALKHQ